MNVSIWDKPNNKWIIIKNIDYIVQLDKDHFKLDGVTYDTNRYELKFIHDARE